MSKVYTKLNFLLQLQSETIVLRKQLLSNMSDEQLEAIVEVVSRHVNGVINPMRRDIQLFQRKDLLLKTVASRLVSLARKKRLLRRHHSIIPIILRTVYLVKAILDEVA